MDRPDERVTHDPTPPSTDSDEQTLDRDPAEGLDCETDATATAVLPGAPSGTG
jgi:hypothetical protein